MKKQALTAFMVLGLMITLAVTPATAQSNSHSMRIRIPFEFTVKDKTLPPGEYVVKRNVSDRPEMLLISSVDGGPGPRRHAFKARRARALAQEERGTP